MRNLIREEADKYQDFFNFMNKEHNLTLTVSEMDEIILEAQKAVNKITSNTMLADSAQIEVCKECGTFVFSKDLLTCTNGHYRLQAKS